ncbi:MAG: tripartite tricarboxylate transporter TctB family protein [Chloroflexi bacterium]|nr:tripartite tricarboxylate transporter TctB family protein [Chloroflexota bacterium]
MKEERIASVALLLIAVTYLGMAFFTIGVPASRQSLGPEAFPKAIGILMIILSALYMMQSFRGVSKEDEARAAAIGADEKLSSYVDFKTVGIMLGLMLVYAFIFERLGYPISTFLVFMAGVLVLDRRHLVRDTLVAACVSFGLYFAFSYLLRVQLPAGPLAWLGW